MNTIKEQYRVFKEDYPDGKLTFVDFFKMYKELFPTQPGEEYCQYVFRALDTDNNGFIGFKEFLLAVNCTSQSRVISGSAEEKLKWVFRVYDVTGNGDGVIDQLEMTKVLQKIHTAYDTSDTRVKSVFNFLDANNDGQLTEEEFVAGCLQDDNLYTFLAPQFLFYVHFKFLSQFKGFIEPKISVLS